MEIIPAIDIIDGKCVRLTQGSFNRKTIYSENPLEVARQFEGIGIKRLHLVDLDGAKSGKVVNYKVLESIAAGTGLAIDFGGGIKTNQDIENVFQAGATFATIGSIAVKKKELFLSWIKKYGASKLILGADVNKEKIAINGWQETTSINVFDFIKEYQAKGINTLFCTDIAKDGLLQGPSSELYKKLLGSFPDLNLIASGGITTTEDLRYLYFMGCSGAIIGKAFYENRITIDQLKKIITNGY